MLPPSLVRIALGLVVAMGGSAAGVSSVVTHADSAGIPVGLVADISGSASIYGVSIRNGAQLAGDTINRAGGINGHQLNLLIGDSATSNAQVVNLYQQYI